MTEYTVVEGVVSIIFTLFLMRGVIAFVKDDLKVGEKKKSTSPSCPGIDVALKWWNIHRDRYTAHYKVSFEYWPSERMVFTDRETSYQAYSEAEDIDENIGRLMTSLERAR